MKNNRAQHLTVSGLQVARPDPNYDQITIWSRLDRRQTLVARFRLRLT